MAIMSQLISPEEFARLDPEVRERVNAFARAGGMVAELFDHAKVPAHLADSRRFQRMHDATLRSARAEVEKYVHEMTRSSGPET
jgi:hypothetical protein